MFIKCAMASDSDEDEGCDGQLTRLYESGGVAGTMYGMLLESIQHYIQALHGRDVWLRVLEHARMRNVVFTTHRRYADEMMVRLAAACAAVPGAGRTTPDQYMHFFGQCFVEYWTHYGYDTIMRVSGRHYRDFLHGIDNLHETMRFSYPKMRTPSFYVECEDKAGCVLHYRSKRGGFTHYVIGQLQQCAIKFYQVTVEVRVMEEKRTESGSHTIYRLDFDNSAYTPIETGNALYPGSRELSHVDAKTFFKVFPFSLVFNSDMRITAVGLTIAQLLPDAAVIGADITKNFMLRRPRMDFTWDSVACLQKVIFELESVSPVVRQQSCAYCVKHRDTSCDCKPGSEAARRLLLKGQMRYIRDLDGIAFLGAPLLNNMEEMKMMGLFINDLNMYDSSRDMVMAGWQHASKLECSIEQQVEKSRRIAENLRQLDEWRQRSETLLYAMIPQQIAVRLRNGEDAISTCEMFNQVTILFSYMIGFTDLCASTPPTQLVECINNVFVIFDAVVDKYNVFKVETLGDAVYMVAGGVPDRKPNHAESVASVGLELIEKVKHIQWPASFHEPLQVRLGMHTGSIVAGVVGKRMPQYCLFGDTVNTAARMQTNSISGKIHISETCQQCLKGSEFVTVFRGRMNVKGKGRMSTYWLAGKSGDPDIKKVCANLRQRQTEILKSLRTSDSYDLRKRHKQSEAQLFGSDVRRDSDIPVFDDVAPADDATTRPSDECDLEKPAVNGCDDAAQGDDSDYITFTAKAPADDADGATGGIAALRRPSTAREVTLTDGATGCTPALRRPSTARDLTITIDLAASPSSSSLSSCGLLSPSLDGSGSTLVMPCGLGLSFEEVSSSLSRSRRPSGADHPPISYGCVAEGVWPAVEIAAQPPCAAAAGRLRDMLRCPFSGMRLGGAAISDDDDDDGEDDEDEDEDEEEEPPRLICHDGGRGDSDSTEEDVPALCGRTGAAAPGGRPDDWSRLWPDTLSRPRSSSVALHTASADAEPESLSRCESAAAGLDSLAVPAAAEAARKHSVPTAPVLPALRAVQAAVLRVRPRLEPPPPSSLETTPHCSTAELVPAFPRFPSLRSEATPVGSLLPLSHVEVACHDPARRASSELQPRCVKPVVNPIVTPELNPPCPNVALETLPHPAAPLTPPLSPSPPGLAVASQLTSDSCVAHDASRCHVFVSSPVTTLRSS